MRQFAPVLALVLLGATAALASAQPYRAREGVESGRFRPLDQILSGIRRERPGSLADVEGPNAGPTGEPRYRLKWVTPDGRVEWLDADARTGRVLGVEGQERGAPLNADPQARRRFLPRGRPDIASPVPDPPSGSPPVYRGGRFGGPGFGGAVPRGRGPGRFRRGH
jgi:hypothetical protein